MPTTSENDPKSTGGSGGGGGAPGSPVKPPEWEVVDGGKKHVSHPPPEPPPFNPIGPPNGPPSSSLHPVRYRDGTPVISGVDLVSNGFGKTWAQARSWSESDVYTTNGTTWTNDTRGVTGNNWVVSQMPRLRSHDADTVVVVEAGTNQKWFDHNGTDWVPRHSLKDSLTPDGTRFVLADSMGNRTLFLDFQSVGRNAETAGQPVHRRRR